MSALVAASSIAGFLEYLGLAEAWAYAAAALIHALLVLNLFIAVAPLIFIWLERKVAGRLQDRLGPTRVGGKFGWLQTLADGIKLIQKEDLCPTAADRMLFRVSPYLVFVASFGAFIVLPFSDGWIAQNLDVGVFFILAVMSLEVVGVILAGYSSGSKWALFGGMREAAQVVSYEIPMAICALVAVTTAGTLSMVDIGRMQAGWFWNWLVFHDPFTFLAFFVYFTVATASVKRAPFDLAEAESELVAGFHTEYSGIRWSYFFMAEYASMFAVSGIATLLFLGGWHIGVPVIEGVGLRCCGPGNYFANLIGMVVFLLKGCGLVFFQMWVRWTLPRLRIDQVMTTCLKYLLPISCFLFVGAAVWPVMLHLATSQAADGSRTTAFSLFEPLGEKLYEHRLREAGPLPAKTKPVAKPSEPVKAEPATKGHATHGRPMVDPAAEPVDPAAEPASTQQSGVTGAPVTGAPIKRAAALTEGGRS